MSSPSQTVCVIIPCYRANLSVAEHAALQRCVTVLGAHPLIVVKPNSLDLTELSARYPQLRIENFADENFCGVQGYNRMLLSDDFYARFARYEYMLIYQLDAFVFRDELLSWCQRGYDYIGAPWLPRATPPGPMTRLRAQIRRVTYRWLDYKDRSGQGAHHAQYDYAVGNGGFSLRRIERMRTVLGQMCDRVQRYRQLGHHTYNEDIFFSIEANRYRQTVKTPDLEEALQFAWESHPTLAAQLNCNALPFGCHGWDKLHRDEWRPIFKRAGYDIDALLDEATLPSINEYQALS